MHMSSNIKEQRELCRIVSLKIKEVDAEYAKNQIISGTENYTYLALLDALKLANNKIKFLLKSEKRYLNYLTNNERATIRAFTQAVPGFILGRKYNSLFGELEKVKAIVREINPVTIETKNEELDELIDAYIDKIDALNSLMHEIQTIHSSVQKKSESISSLCESSGEMEGNASDFLYAIRALLKEAENIKENIGKNSTEVEFVTKNTLRTLREAKSETLSLKEDCLRSADEIVKSHDLLLELEKKIGEYGARIKGWSKQREHDQSTVTSLIDDAKKALNYTTASSLSDAFKLQYKISNKHVVTQRWLNYAVLFLVLSFCIGLWALYNAESLSIEIILSRFLLMPLAVGGAWFCSSHYVKQKNIAEDYAYKTVLAKSIVGFSEQLSKNSNQGDEYKKYIEKMLDEIHRDPIRRNERRNVKAAELDELLKKVNEIKPTLDKIIESVTKNK